LKNLSDSGDIHRASQNIKENIKTPESLDLHEYKQHKPWFDEEFLGFLDQMKQAKMQRVKDPNQTNLHNLNYVRHQAGKYFKEKRRNSWKLNWMKLKETVI